MWTAIFFNEQEFIDKDVVIKSLLHEVVRPAILEKYLVLILEARSNPKLYLPGRNLIWPLLRLEH